MVLDTPVYQTQYLTEPACPCTSLAPRALSYLPFKPDQMNAYTLQLDGRTTRNVVVSTISGGLYKEVILIQNVKWSQCMLYQKKYMKSWWCVKPFLLVKFVRRPCGLLSIINLRFWRYRVTSDCHLKGSNRFHCVRRTKPHPHHYHFDNSSGWIRRKWMDTDFERENSWSNMMVYVFLYIYVFTNIIIILKNISNDNLIQIHFPFSFNEFHSFIL